MFCSNCGEKLPENAYFCFKCGVITSHGVEAGAAYPWRWDKEVQKALSTAAQEVEKAFNNLRENINQSIKRETVSCPQCGEKNQPDSTFCHNCGKKLN